MGAFRVIKKNQQGVQNHKGKTTFKVLSIKKIELVFTTAALEKLNREFSAATDGYDKQSAKLAEKALTVAATYSPVVERLSEVLGNLDVLCSFARVVATAPCAFARPRIDLAGKTFT